MYFNMIKTLPSLRWTKLDEEKWGCMPKQYLNDQIHNYVFVWKIATESTAKYSS